MYDIGTILKIKGTSYEYPPHGILTGMVVGYFYSDQEPKNVVLCYKDNAYDGGIFGVANYTTYELATKAEVQGKCDITAFINETSHLKNLFGLLEERGANLEEALDTIHRNKRDLAAQIEKLE